MPATKNALLRYKVLDKCFRNPGKKYFIDDLIEVCTKAMQEHNPDSSGISRRQVFEDIAFMESNAGWSIDLMRLKEGKRVYYRYEDVSFSINNMPLNEVEVAQLQDAVHSLSQFKGMPQFEWVSEMLPRLMQGMEAGQSVISFDANEYLKGIEHLGSLYSAIKFKKVLEIKYKPFESEDAIGYIIHPYYLKQYNGRWFLFGLNAENNHPGWNLALDRIEAIKELRQRYKPTEMDWNAYFDDIVGVTIPAEGKVQQIILHFYGKAGHYIITKPMHHSQKAKWIAENLLEVRMELILNLELERLVLSFGESVKVLKPATLQKAVLHSLREAIEHYK